MLGLAIELAAWLKADQERPQLERHRRDRAIATELGLGDELNGFPAQLGALDRWWSHAERSSYELPLRGRAIERSRTLIRVLLVLLGFILGSGIASAALRYDGTAPVNLVSAIAWLVLLPGLFLLLTLLLLPGRLPLAGWLQDIVATFSPGQWASQWLNRRFAGLDLGWRGAAPRYLGDDELSLSLPGIRRVSKWQMLEFSQLLALSYALGGLATLVGLVTFTDMAFGWSTTLELSADRVTRWVELAASPWALLWPAAAPSAELVEASRFYRAAGVEGSVAAKLGAWWPFLLMTLLCYAVLPRALLLWLARHRLRRAEQHLVLEQPGVRRLLQRMTTPLATYAAPLPEEEQPLTPPVRSRNVDAETDRLVVPEGQRCQLVIWNDALPVNRLDAWLERSGPMPAPLRLGAAVPLAEEASLLAALPESDLLIVFAKAWEPPLLELQDFLRRLTERLSAGGRVLVVPVGIHAARPEVNDLAIWLQTIALLDDVRIQVWGTP